MSNNVIVIRNDASADVLLEIYKVIDEIARNHPEIANKLYYTNDEMKKLELVKGAKYEEN